MSETRDIRDRLYELMPVLYRERDEQQGYPLRELLRIVTEQADIVDTDIARLWDDFFIETCEPWAIPYIGDLVGNRLLLDAQRPRRARYRARAVPRPRRARICAPPNRDPHARRRREDDLLPAPQGHAADARGAGARRHRLGRARGGVLRAARAGRSIATTCACTAPRCPDLRSVEADGPPRRRRSTTCPTPSTCARPAQHEGWHNIRNIGFFLWRLGAYPLEQRARRGRAARRGRFHFSPLGNRAPLFSRARGARATRRGSRPSCTCRGPIRPRSVLRHAASATPRVLRTVRHDPRRDRSSDRASIRDGVRCRSTRSAAPISTTWAQPTGGLVRHRRAARPLRPRQTLVPALAWSRSVITTASRPTSAADRIARATGWLNAGSAESAAPTSSTKAGAPTFPTIDCRSLRSGWPPGGPDASSASATTARYGQHSPIELGRRRLPRHRGRRRHASSPCASPAARWRSPAIIRAPSSRSAGLLVEGAVTSKATSNACARSAHNLGSRR